MVVASHADGCRIDSRLMLHRYILCTRRSGGTAHEDGCATSQLHLPYVTPFSVAECSRLQLGVTHRATSVDYCKQLIIDLTFCGSRFSTVRLLAQKTLPLYFINSK